MAFHGAFVVDMAAIDTQAAAVCRQLLHIKDPQSGCGKDAVDRVKREIGIVLVIDRVKLGVFNQAHEVGKFKGNGSTRLERRSQPGGEVHKVRHMGIDIIADNQVGLFAFLAEFFGKRRAEKLPENRNAHLFRRRRRGGCRLNTEAEDVPGNEIF